MKREKSALVDYPVHPFDKRNGTDTGGLTPGRKLTTGHAHDRHNTAYYAIAPSIFRRLVAQWKRLEKPRQMGEYTMVDVGAGKGRGMLLGSESGFKQVVGVELHAELAGVCRRNLRVWRATHADAGPMRLSVGDATEIQFPAGPCVAFLFNPFEAPVMRRLLREMAAQFERRAGLLEILYANHEHEKVLREDGRFRPMWRGKVKMSAEDEHAEALIMATQNEYASTGDEWCSIWRFTG